MDEEKYDLIISNPPFYEAPLITLNEEDSMPDARKKARFYDSLPFVDLLEYSSSLLADEGEFAVIIPYTEEMRFLQLAKSYNLFPNRITRVRGTKEAPLKRSLLQLSYTEAKAEEDELIIEVSRHEYTSEYIELVKDFYLKM